MKLFAGSIFTDQEFIFYGLYLIVCAIAIGAILFFVIRILVNALNKRPLNKLDIIFLISSALVLFLANIFIDL